MILNVQSVFENDQCEDLTVGIKFSQFSPSFNMILFSFSSNHLSFLFVSLVMPTALLNIPLDSEIIIPIYTKFSIDYSQKKKGNFWITIPRNEQIVFNGKRGELNKDLVVKIVSPKMRIINRMDVILPIGKGMSIRKNEIIRKDNEITCKDGNEKKSEDDSCDQRENNSATAGKIMKSTGLHLHLKPKSISGKLNRDFSFTVSKYVEGETCEYIPEDNLEKGCKLTVYCTKYDKVLKSKFMTNEEAVVYSVTEGQIIAVGSISGKAVLLKIVILMVALVTLVIIVLVKQIRKIHKSGKRLDIWS